MRSIFVEYLSKKMHLYICLILLCTIACVYVRVYKRALKCVPSVCVFLCETYECALRPRVNAQNIKQFSACTTVMCAITINYPCIGCYVIVVVASVSAYSLFVSFFWFAKIQLNT